jgi:hypothetical protein
VLSTFGKLLFGWCLLLVLMLGASRVQAREFRIAIDVNYNSLMSSKVQSGLFTQLTNVAQEIDSLVQQIQVVLGFSRRAPIPFHISVTGVSEDGAVRKSLDHIPNWQHWPAVDVIATPLHAHFSSKLASLVYMSPDATEVLDRVEEGKVYVIGGLIDTTRLKVHSFSGARKLKYMQNQSLERAKQLGVPARKLPVREFVTPLRDHVLNVSDGTAAAVLRFCLTSGVWTVGELLMLQLEHGNWAQAFASFAASNSRRFTYCGPTVAVPEAAAAPAFAGTLATHALDSAVT